MCLIGSSVIVTFQTSFKLTYVINFRTPESDTSWVKSSITVLKQKETEIPTLLKFDT